MTNNIDKNKLDIKNTVSDYLSGNLKQQFMGNLKNILPKHFDAERMVRLALNEFRANPALGRCNPLSVIGAVLKCSQLGLEPGSTLGHAYLIPYGQECSFILGYRGMLDLIRRTGQVRSIRAEIVYKNDLFEYELGLDEKLKHVPAQENRGPMIFAYACVKFVDGGFQFSVMSKEDVELVRESSRSKNSAPWQKFYDEMAKKTVIRRLFKYLPISIELQKALNLDEQGEYGSQNTMVFDDFDLSEAFKNDMDFENKDISEENSNFNNNVTNKLSSAISNIEEKQKDISNVP